MATLEQTAIALEAAIQAALPGRIVTRDFMPISQRKDAELRQGVVCLVFRGEGGYANTLGREAQLGVCKVLLVGQLMVDEKLARRQIEQAEFALAEEVKHFLQGNFPPEVADCLGNDFAQSGQVDFPYGWIVFELEVRGG